MGHQTWKDTKQQYLLMLIKEGGLSNSQLDDLIAETQRMTSDRGHLQVDSIDGMRQLVDFYAAKDGGDALHFKFKYVILGNSTPVPVIFGDLIGHNEVAHGRYVKSAGFCYISQNGGAKCFGENISLGIKSDPAEDADIINRQFKLTEQYRY